MGGELGTRVANASRPTRPWRPWSASTSTRPGAGSRRAEFHRVDPRQRSGCVDLVRDFDPTTVVHLGVYEPNARAGPNSAAGSHRGGDGRGARRRRRVPVAGAHRGPLRHRGLRAGPGHADPTRRGRHPPPDVAVRPDRCCDVEQVAARAAAVADVPVAFLRCAPIVGSHLASPLGRYLRLPVVPVSLFSDLPFSLLHHDDAGAVVVAAARAGLDGPLNVVGPGAVTPVQAALLGGRVPLPIVGRHGCSPASRPRSSAHRCPTTSTSCWCGAAAPTAAGAPLLGVAPEWSTPEVVHELYEWAPVTYLQPGRSEAA